MAEILIRLSYNLKTGKKDIYIDLESDADALPVEHERHHRQVVEKLLGKGILKPDEVGQIHVSRAEPGQAASPAQAQRTEPAAQRAVGQS